MSVNVLVWGHVLNGACAYFRGYEYDPILPKYGVEIRHISRIDELAITRGGEEIAPESLTLGSLREGIASGELRATSPDIEWADVIVFRRYYNTSLKCEPCGFVTHDPNAADAHNRTPGHQAAPQDFITRLMWPAIRERTDKAIVYETDDLHLGIGVRKWNGYHADANAERDLIEEMVKRADLVTVSTPNLKRELSRWAERIRVIRNAIDPSLYETDVPRPEGDKTRLLYYGNTARMRDYIGSCRTCGVSLLSCYCGQFKREGGFASLAVEELKRDLHRIFIGVSEGTEEVMEHYWDEMYGYMEDIPAFSRKMADVHPDIGIAPLVGDDFDANKSELHWLEYTMAGAATIAQRWSGGPDAGPYNVIRDGVDGLLAKGRQEWYDALRRLIREPNLRADLASAARERVLADYHFEKRAEEWAAAFYWAADHAGIGARKPLEMAA
jgi:glycosyltransferase involved in cell wall biosynthesis